MDEYHKFAKRTDKLYKEFAKYYSDDIRDAKNKEQKFLKNRNLISNEEIYKQNKEIESGTAEIGLLISKETEQMNIEFAQKLDSEIFAMKKSAKQFKWGVFFMPAFILILLIASTMLFGNDESYVGDVVNVVNDNVLNESSQIELSESEEKLVSAVISKVFKKILSVGLKPFVLANPLLILGFAMGYLIILYIYYKFCAKASFNYFTKKFQKFSIQFSKEFEQISLAYQQEFDKNLITIGGYLNDAIIGRK